MSASLFATRRSGLPNYSYAPPASDICSLMKRLSPPLPGDKLHDWSVLAGRHALLTSKEAREVSRRVETQIERNILKGHLMLRDTFDRQIHPQHAAESRRCHAGLLVE